MINNGILKKLILQEIRKVLKESDFEDYDEPEEDEDEDDEDAEKGMGIEFDGKTYSPKEFTEAFHLVVSDPDSAFADLYSEAESKGTIGKKIKNTDGEKEIYFFNIDPYQAEIVRDSDYTVILIGGSSRREVDELYNSLEQEL